MNRIIKSYSVIATLIVSSCFAPSVHTATIWASDNAGRLGTIDTATQAVNIIGTMRTAMTDIAFDPSGNLWGISASSLYKINKNNANTTLIGNLGTSAKALTFGSDGTLYTANTSLYTINTTSGAASLVGKGEDDYSASGDLAFIDNTLYLSAIRGDRLLTINTANGHGDEIGTIGFNQVDGLAGTHQDKLLGISGTSLLSIDLSTGVGTALFDFADKGFSTNYGATIAPVPLPAALWLFAVALVGLLVMISKKNERRYGKSIF